MSAPNSPKKRGKRKSFFCKLTRAFSRRKSKSGDESSDSDEYKTMSNDSTPGTSPKGSPVKKNLAGPLTGGKQPADKVSAVADGWHGDKISKQSENLNDTKSGDSSNFAGQIASLNKNIVGLLDQDDTPSRPARNNQGFKADGESGSDRYLDLKKNFIENSPSMEFKQTQVVMKNNEVTVGNKTPESKGTDVVSQEEIKNIIDTSKQENVNVTKTLLIKERPKEHCNSDSDESDSSHYPSDEEGSDSEPEKINIKDLYFTTGKYITYFFLEMERKWYNPKEETYAYIHYNCSNRNSVKHHHRGIS